MPQGVQVQVLSPAPNIINPNLKLTGKGFGFVIYLYRCKIPPLLSEAKDGDECLIFRLKLKYHSSYEAPSSLYVGESSHHYRNKYLQTAKESNLYEYPTL